MTTAEFSEMKNSIAALDTSALWLIVGAPIANSERAANALCYAKAELRRRGYMVI